MATEAELLDALKNADAAGDAEAARALADAVIQMRQQSGGSGQPAPAATSAAEPPPPAPVAAPYRPGVDGPLIPGAPMTEEDRAALAIRDAQPEPSLVDRIMGLPAQFPGSPVQQAPAPGGSYALDTANQFAEGATRGITNIAGLPVDAINAIPMLANLIPGVDGVGPISQNPVGGSQSFYGAADTVADAAYAAATLGGERPDTPEPQDFMQRMFRRTGEEIGAAALPGAALVRKGAQIGVEGARQLPAWQRAFLEPAAVDPAKFMQKDALAALTIGTGGTGLNELFGNADRSNPWLDLAASAGSVAGVSGLSAVTKSLGDIGRAVMGSGNYADEVVTEAVMRDIANAAGIAAPHGEAPDLAPLIRATEQGQRVGNVVPGYTESLADRTGNAGLAATEYSRQGGANAGMYTQRRADNSNAIDQALAASEPQATPGQFSAGLEAERTRQLSEAGAATANAQGAYDQVAGRLAPEMTGEARGANIRGALGDARDAAREVERQAWQPINEARNTPVNIAPLADSFAEADAQVPRALQDLIPPASRVPGSFVQEGATEAPLSEVMGTRSALTNDLRRSDITPQEQAMVNERVKRTDAYLDENMPAEMRGQYDSARAASRDFNDRFTRPQSAIGQVLDTREGQPRYPDSSVARRFVQSDEQRVSDLEALMREAGNDDRTRSGMRDQILADVRDRNLLDDPEQLNDYLGRYSTLFKHFPDEKAELGTAAGLRRQLADAQEAEKGLRDMLTQQNRSAVANYLTYGDENAHKAMNGVLASRDPAKTADELLAFVGNDAKAVEGARKAFWEVLQNKSRAGGRTTANIDGQQPWSPRALGDFLDNPANSAVAERLWRDNPEHLENIRGVAEALRSVDTRNSAKAPNTSGTGQAAFSQLLSPEALQSRWYAYSSGRISGTFLVTSILSTLARRGVRRVQEAAYQRMMDDALLNPDVAAKLMRENNPANRAALSGRAKMWLGNQASSILNAMSADDPSEHEAIMRDN